MLKQSISLALCLLSMQCAAYSAIINTDARNGQSVIAQAAKGNAVILFYKPSCPSCTYIKPLFTQLAAQHQKEAQFIMVNITANDSLYKSKYGFSTVPTVVYLSKGRIISKHGSNNRNVKLADMKRHVQSMPAC